MVKDQPFEQMFSNMPSETDGARMATAVQPVHVVYGGAHLFKKETPEKLGRIALESQRSYAPDFITFSKAMWLNGADSLPDSAETALDLIELINSRPEEAEERYPGSAFCLEVFRKTVGRLRSTPVEDFRIDFEDGYGFRTDEEEDAHAESASSALAEILTDGAHDTEKPTLFGFRIKSFKRETRQRSVRTLEMFLTNLIDKTAGNVSPDLVVTLPKVSTAAEVEVLAEILEKLEVTLAGKRLGLGIEIMIETPKAVSNLSELANCAPGRLRSAHFGAYDYTAALGISSGHQHLRHDACNFARNAMLNEFSQKGIWLSDSVTVEMPVPVHRGGPLTDAQVRENFAAVRKGWRAHFNNVTHSMINGFYQSWDLHPAQLVARFAAVYAFYLSERGRQMARLKAFVDKASQAVLTGNVFDDAASAEGILNFFRRGCGCGAFEYGSTASEAGLEPEQIRSGNFAEIMAQKGEV
jgi:hypothetical protein